MQVIRQFRLVFRLESFISVKILGCQRVLDETHVAVASYFAYERYWTPFARTNVCWKKKVFCVTFCTTLMADPKIDFIAQWNLSLRIKINWNIKLWKLITLKLGNTPAFWDTRYPFAKTNNSEEKNPVINNK